MESLTIFEIAQRLIGGITPIGETNYDEICLHNIKEWDDLLYHVTQLFIESAKGESGRYLKSVKEVSDKSREKLEWIYEYIGNYLKDWKREESIGEPKCD